MKMDGVTALKEDWVAKLDDALYVMNSRSLESDVNGNSVSPFELMFARPLRQTTNAVLERFNNEKSFRLLRGAQPLKEKVHKPTVEEASRASKENRTLLTSRFERTWEDMREKSRQESIRAASKLSVQKIVVGDWGPYKVEQVQGVSVVVNAKGKKVTDSVAHVLKVVSPNEGVQIGDVHVHCPGEGEAETFYANSTICDLNAVESVGLSPLPPMLSKMTDKESNWQAEKANPTSLSPRRSKESIIKLFEATITEAINGGWVTLHEHYSYYFEDTVGGKEKVKTLFGCDFMNEVNDNQCNAQAINDKFKVEGETYLPACVQQLRRKGLDGTTNSISVGQDGVNREVSSPLVEPAVVGCIMAICMCWRLTMSEGIEAFLGGCRGVCFRQCWLCAPWVKVKEDGSQLATTWIGRESDGEEWVNHCDTEEHTYKEYMLRIYGLSFLGITQAMVEGARWTYELAYETWNSQGSKLATNKCDREGLLSEGKYMPASKHLRCLVCIDSTKTPASDWQLSAHWSGGFGSKKETQHSYYIKRAFYEANYVGSRTDPRFCYLEGRPPLISNKNVSKSPTWMSTWKKCSDLGLGYTALTLRLVKEPVFKALNEIVGRVCSAATVDLQEFTPSTEDPIGYEALDIGSISPLVVKPVKETPPTSPSKSNNFFSKLVDLSQRSDTPMSTEGGKDVQTGDTQDKVGDIQSQIDEIKSNLSRLTTMVEEALQDRGSRDWVREDYRERPYKKNWGKRYDFDDGWHKKGDDGWNKRHSSGSSGSRW
ncbi:hypothetical protein FOZ62_029527, partial [Perkinsus olseni]